MILSSTKVPIFTAPYMGPHLMHHIYWLWLGLGDTENSTLKTENTMIIANIALYILSSQTEQIIIVHVYHKQLQQHLMLNLSISMDLWISIVVV